MLGKVLLEGSLSAGVVFFLSRRLAISSRLPDGFSLENTTIWIMAGSLFG
jgi:hypothetical protein